jgi:spore germination cell wall hydrolase CwlJ-like protein|tara:strand:- start:391 stop:873 length:483 start_codon:yes stop_codon:yes gene_type:complete
MKQIILSIWLCILLYPIESYAESDAEYHCLVEAIYFEARSESQIGQLAVANVILERVRQLSYPNTICKVVHQWKGHPKLNGCSFSYYCDGKKEVMHEKEALLLAMDIATLALDGAVVEDIWGATHYHTRYVEPYWIGEMSYLGSIGDHLFYERSYSYDEY